MSNLSISSKLTVTIMMFGAFFGVLNQTILSTVLPFIMDDMNISSSQAQWLVTLFMLMIGIIIPITALLTEKLGSRKLFLISIFLLTIGSIVAWWAQSFPILLIGRGIQGLGAGALMPLIQTVLFSIFPPNKRGTAMGMFGLVIGFAPAIGPPIASWITNLSSWRILFMIISILMILIFILSLIFVRETIEREYVKIDNTSIILSTIGFSSLLFVSSTISTLEINNLIVIIVSLISVIAIYAFVVRQLKMEHPVLDFKVFQVRGFTIPIVNIVLMFTLFLGNMTIIPLYLQTMRSYDVSISGLVLLIGGLIMGGFAPLMGKLYDKYGGRPISIISMLLICTSMLMFMFMNDKTSILYIMIAISIQSIGNSGIITPMTTESINMLPKRLIPHGSSMNNTLRQIGAAIGTAFLVGMLNTGTTTVNGQVQYDGIFLTYSIGLCISIAGLIFSIAMRKTHPSDN